METALPTQSQGLGKSPSGPFRGLLTDAIRFWEPRRLIYNLVLAVVVVVWIVASWPHFRPALTPHSLLLLCLSVGGSLRRLRWGLWVIGTLFAILFENYWIADEIYPFVR